MITRLYLFTYFTEDEYYAEHSKYNITYDQAVEIHNNMLALQSEWDYEVQWGPTEECYHAYWLEFVDEDKALLFKLTCL